VINFFFFVAEDLRRIMAELGFRTVNEMVGRVDCLVQRTDIEHWKAKGIDLSAVLYNPPVPSHVGRRHMQAQDHGLEQALDRKLIEMTQETIENRTPVSLSMPIRNIHAPLAPC
jgi:glutamate synthase (NADPH/NADH) large chain